MNLDLNEQNKGLKLGGSSDDFNIENEMARKRQIQYANNPMTEEQKYKIDPQLLSANEEILKNLDIDGLRKEIANMQTSLQGFKSSLPKELFNQSFINKIKESQGQIAVAEENASALYKSKLQDITKAIAIFTRAEARLLTYTELLGSLQKDVASSINVGLSRLHQAPEEYKNLQEKVWQTQKDIDQEIAKFDRSKTSSWMIAFFMGIAVCCLSIASYTYFTSKDQEARKAFEYIKKTYPGIVPEILENIKNEK
jgi:hypothetical protein